jgi:hypothetical protein
MRPAAGLGAVGQEADPGMATDAAAPVGAVQIVAGDPKPGAGDHHVVRAHAAAAGVQARAAGAGEQAPAGGAGAQAGWPGRGYAASRSTVLCTVPEASAVRPSRVVTQP